jgi:hypothetical protein
MSKKHCCLPPGKADEIFTRVEELEHRLAALEDAARAFAVVYAIPRVSAKPGGTDDEHQ